MFLFFSSNRHQTVMEYKAISPAGRIPTHKILPAASFLRHAGLPYGSLAPNLFSLPSPGRNSKGQPSDYGCPFSCNANSCKVYGCVYHSTRSPFSLAALNTASKASAFITVSIISCPSSGIFSGSSSHSISQ